MKLVKLNQENVQNSFFLEIVQVKTYKFQGNLQLFLKDRDKNLACLVEDYLDYKNVRAKQYLCLIQQRSYS